MNVDYLESEYFLLKADRQFEREQYYKARKTLEYALRADPTNGQVHSYLGWYYYTQLKNYKRAQTHYELALKYYPEFAGTYYNYCTVLDQLKDYETMLAIADKGKEVAGVDAEAMDVEAVSALEKLDRLNDAVQRCKLALAGAQNPFYINQLETSLDRLRTKIKSREPWYLALW